MATKTAGRAAMTTTLWVLLGLCMGIHHAAAADWPRWRGPDGNGISMEQNWNPKALDALRIKWSVELGTGYSSLAIAHNRVYTQGIQGKDCVIYCLDADTGREIWTHRYPRGSDNQPGPRSTPSVDGSEVYVSSREGDLFCLDAAKGSVLWARNLIKEEALPNVTWGLASSPMIIGARIYLNIGEHGIALEKRTGKTLWRSPAEPGGYATPAPFTLNGEEALAIFSAKAIFAVRAKDGTVLWRKEWKTSYDINAADPIIADNLMFISSGYNRGAAALKLSASGDPDLAWESKEMCTQFGTPVLLNGYLYACSGNTGRGNLQCMEMKTGQIKWTEKTGFCSVILVNGKLVVLNEDGQLIIALASPDGFKPISNAQVLHKKVCWTPPAFADGSIYCRNHPGTLVCVDVSR